MAIDPTEQYILQLGQTYVYNHDDYNDETVDPPISYISVDCIEDVLKAEYMDEATAKTLAQNIGGTLYKVTHTYEETDPAQLKSVEETPVNPTPQVKINNVSNKAPVQTVKIGEDIPDDLGKNVDKDNDNGKM